MRPLPIYKGRDHLEGMIGEERFLWVSRILKIIVRENLNLNMDMEGRGIDIEEIGMEGDMREIEIGWMETLGA